MMTGNKFPILEFDDNKTAKFNPASFAEKSFDTNKKIITFFTEVIEKLYHFEKLLLK